MAELKTKKSSNEILQYSSGKRISKRVYPQKECASPTCKRLFIPTDKRQIYCEPQCRINHNNDMREVKNRQRDAHAILTIRNEEILMALYDSIENLPQKEIHLDVLRISKYRNEITTDVGINNETGNFIYWNYNYGLEGASDDNLTFIIHNRDKTPY